MKDRKKARLEKAVGIAVFATLALSAVYSLLGAISASGAGPRLVIESGKTRGDYLLMLVECLLGILVMFLPSMLEKRLRIAIPGGMYLVFVLFLYAGIYLGEVRSFYYRFANWDTVLHAFSGVMLGALGFSVVSLLNDSEKVAVSLSPLFVALFAFCFAVALGVVWEIYEFGVDGLLGLNMQKFATEGGAPLAGRAALVDTMSDLIVDSLAAFAVSALGYASLRLKTGWLERIEIRRKGARREK